MRRALERAVKEEGGFTLSEMLVTMLVMVMVLVALYNIFDMSIKIFAFGNDKVEVTETARLGLAKVERELRMAAPVNKAAGLRHRFFTAGSPSTPAPIATGSQISFGNDLNGDYAIGSGESITYQLSSTGPPYEMLRRVDNGTPQPVIQFVGEFDDGTPGLRFTPLTSGGGVPAGQAQVQRVRIEVVVEKGGTRQVLRSDVALRNGGA